MGERLMRFWGAKTGGSGRREACSGRVRFVGLLTNFIGIGTFREVFPDFPGGFLPRFALRRQLPGCSGPVPE
jgi:hypothetical protein